MAGSKPEGKNPECKAGNEIPFEDMPELHTEVQFLKGIGPRVAETLATKGIFTLEDVLYYLPFRYEDRINPRTIEQLQAGRDGVGHRRGA